MRVRHEKMDELREEGIDPFGHEFKPTALAKDLTEEYDKYSKEELEEKDVTVTIAGRMVAKRGSGKVGFADILDRSGRMQIYIRKDVVGEEKYHIFKRSDIGDFLGFTGEVIKTDMGQLTVRVTDVTFLSKALRPLPDKFHGLQNKEQKYRQRYLDLISNRESFDRFQNRAKIISAIRNFLDNELDVTEVETPGLHASAGGASAR